MQLFSQYNGTPTTYQKEGASAIWLVSLPFYFLSLFFVVLLLPFFFVVLLLPFFALHLYLSDRLTSTRAIFKPI